MDRVRVMKREWAASGGDPAEEEAFPVEIEPNEDAIDCRRVYLQADTGEDENVFVDRDGDDLVFRDVNNPTPQTMSQVVAGSSGVGLLVFKIDGGLVYDLAGNVLLKGAS